MAVKILEYRLSSNCDVQAVKHIGACIYARTVWYAFKTDNNIFFVLCTGQYTIYTVGDISVQEQHEYMLHAHLKRRYFAQLNS